MSYIGLKNLSTILMIAIDLVYDAIEYIDELIYLYPEFVGKKKEVMNMSIISLVE